MFIAIVVLVSCLKCHLKISTEIMVFPNGNVVEVINNTIPDGGDADTPSESVTKIISGNEMAFIYGELSYDEIEGDYYNFKVRKIEGDSVFYDINGSVEVNGIDYNTEQWADFGWTHRQVIDSVLSQCPDAITVIHDSTNIYGGWPADIARITIED